MKCYPLTQAQKRIWYSQKKYKGAALYNIGGTVQISGAANLDKLGEAIQTVCRNNAALQLRFTEKGDCVRQYLSKEAVQIEKIDFSVYSEPEKAFRNWCEGQARTPFEINDHPLCYFAVFQVTSECTGYYIKMHHIVSDGWSVKLLTDQVRDAYQQLIQGKTAEEQHKPSYIEYIEDEEIYLNSDKIMEAENFWTNKMISLPSQSINNRGDTEIRGNRKSFFFESDVQSRIEDYVNNMGFSLNSFFICLYMIYEYKKNGSKDISLGMPLLGRSGGRERRIFGTFTNTMPCRYFVEEDKHVASAMKEIAEEIRNSFKYQKYPCNYLQDRLELNKKGGSLYDTCVNYYNTTICTTIDGMEANNEELYNGCQEYLLQIIIRHWKIEKDGRSEVGERKELGNRGREKLQIDVDYQLSQYKDEEIDHMFCHLCSLIVQITKNQDIKIQNLTLADKEELLKSLYEYNDTSAVYPYMETAIELFEKTALKQPDKTAVSVGGNRISYSQLNRMSDAAASALIKRGIQKGDKIAVIPGYTVTSIASILGVMKCGAVYLPIYRGIPDERRKKLLLESGAVCTLVEQGTVPIGDCILMEDITGGGRESENIHIAGPEDIAYLLYTSGSSGEPKGVMVKHRNIMNYLWWAQNTYIRNENEVFPLFTSFAFDFTMTSLLLPLIGGHEIRLYDNTEGGDILQKVVSEKKATILKITPSHIPLLESDAAAESAVHTIIVGGENFNVTACRRLYKLFGEGIRIINEYGPTEATVGCIAYCCNGKEEGMSVPIGKPIFNMEAYLLDMDGEPVPDYIIGELFVSGDGVSGGYYMEMEKTAAKFMDNPFRTDKIMYKTGDLAYRDKDGNFVYCGRKDRQCKIRGNRIDLNEIEKHITESGLVRDTLAKVVDISEDSQCLCAYITVDDKLEEARLRLYLKKYLADYMIPDFFIQVEYFPINENGKLDSDSLPAPVTSGENQDQQESSQFSLLSEGIKKILIVPKTSIKDNFIEMGGDSIKAIFLSSWLHERGYELTSPDILLHPILGDMVTYIKDREDTIRHEGIIAGKVGITPITRWFLDRNYRQEGFYNQSVLLEYKQNQQSDNLNEILLELVKIHDGLRLNVQSERDGLFYNSEHLKVKNLLTVINCSNSDFQVNSIIEKYTNPEFDIYKDLLFRVYLITSPQKKYIYIILHHLVTDGLSIRIILRDLCSLLIEGTGRIKYLQGARTASYQQYAERFSVNNQITSSQGTPEWETCSFAETTTDTFELSETISRQLTGKVDGRTGMSVEALLLSSVVMAFKETFRWQEISVDMESHGRDLVKDLNINNTVGWFTLIYPVKLRLSGENMTEQTKYVKEQISAACKKLEMDIHTGYLMAGPIEQSMLRFNYLGEYMDFNSKILSLAEWMNQQDIGPENYFGYLADINIIKWEGKLKAHIRYAESMRDKGIYITSKIKKLLGEILSCCEGIDNRNYMPSDFDMVQITQEDLDKLLS